MIGAIYEALVALVGKINPVYDTGPIEIPGITAAAYLALDAMGARFEVPVPKSGTIEAARFYDLSDQGLGMKLWMFKSAFTATADNSPLAPSDSDLLNFEGAISFSNFHDGNTGQVASEDALGISYVAPKGVLYCQMQCLGAPTISAAAFPKISLRIIPD